MSLDLGAIEARYSAALDARPSKGAEIGSDSYTALTDSVADIPELLAEVQRLQPIRDGEHRYLSTYCLHWLHHLCRLTCKVCKSPCRCDCHGAAA